MKKITYLSLVGTALVLCVGSFQNCSKMAATDLVSTMSLAAVSDASSVVDTSQTAVLVPQAPDQDAVVGSQPDAPAEVSAPAVDLLQPQDEAVAVAECSKRSNLRPLSEGPNYSNLRGSHEIIDDEISNFENNNGNLIVRPLSSRGHIVSMNGNGGNQLVCNMDIDLIENSNGNLTLVNCRVKDLRSNRGVVKSFGSSIERTDSKVILYTAEQRK